MARIGYAARGLVFLIVGGFALLAAGGSSERPQGMSDALQTLFDQPFGGVLLWTVAAGLSCFAAWRLLQAVFDADQHGRSLRGLTRRSTYAVSGLFYLALAATTARIAYGARGMSEDQSARDWAHWLMVKPLGRGLIALIGTVLIGIAIVLAVTAFRAPYRRRLDARLLPAGIWVLRDHQSIGTPDPAAEISGLGDFQSFCGLPYLPAVGVWIITHYEAPTRRHRSSV